MLTHDVREIRLTALGESQAQYLTQSFEESPSLIVTSPYLRTQQTAQPTLARFPAVAHEEWPVQEFTYLSRLVGAGTTVIQRRPFVQRYWQRADPFYVDGPGAESFSNLISRIQATLNRLKESEERFITIFTHGLFMRTLLWFLLATPAEITSEHMKQCHAFCESFAVANAGILKMQLTEMNELYFGPIVTTHLPHQLLQP